MSDTREQTLHQLLQQQMNSLGIDPEIAPTAEQWDALQETVTRTYQESEVTRRQWQEAYTALRDEMEGSYESLRRSSADLLRNERDKLQSVINALGEGLCSLNENGCLLFMNPEAEHLLGWTETEIRGQLILDWIMPSGEEETTTDRMLHILRQGQAYKRDEATFIRQNGRQLPVSYNIDPVTRNGKFGGAVLAFRDITAYKAAQHERERKLQETLLLNRVIAATTSTLELKEILLTICEELAQFMNLPQAAFALLNEAKDHLTIVAEYLDEGRIPALGTIIPVENNPATQWVLTHRKPLLIPDAQTDPRQRAVQDIARRRGTRSMMIVPLMVRGEVLGTLGLNATTIRSFDEGEMQLAQNVASAASQAMENAQLYTSLQQELAERRAAEEALAQARDKALEASRLKSELIAKVSHELRTPLGSIMGFTEMLQLGIYGDVSEEQETILHNIIKSTDNLVILVNDLLDAAQLEAGKVALKNQPFSPQELIDRMENTMRVLAESKGLMLETTVADELPPRLLGDIDRLYQILVNFVTNALKFTKQGEIRVTLYPYENDFWAMSVRDTGSGIPADQQELIFEQFQQVRFSPTREESGVGLGLSIVKQLVELMHGRIELHSEPDQGSEFIVILPQRVPKGETAHE